MNAFLVLVLVVGLPIVALALADCERARRPRPVEIRPADSHVRQVPTRDLPRPRPRDLPRSIAVETWAAGGTPVEARTMQARREVARLSARFGDEIRRGAR